MMGLTLLTVEDCSVMQAIIERTVHIMDLNIKTCLKAKNGREGLELLSNHSVDLIILDMNMPQMSGMEMLKEIEVRPNLKNIPVLIVSMESNERRIREYKKISDGFVHKPFTPETLKANILQLLENKHLIEKA